MLSLTFHWFCIESWTFWKLVGSNICVSGCHVNENIFIAWVNGLLHWKLLKPVGRQQLLDLDANKDREEGDYVTYDAQQLSGWETLSFILDEGPNMLATMQWL